MTKRMDTFTKADVDRMVQLHNAGKSMRDIGKIMDIPYTYVSKCLAFRDDVDVDRERTRKATTTRLRMLEARRVAQAVELAEDIDNLRQRMWEEYEQVVATAEGVEHVYLSEPPLNEQARAANAISSLVAAQQRLISDVKPESDNKGGSVIDSLVDNLKSLVTSGKDQETEAYGYDPRDQDSDYDIATDPEVWERN